MWWSNKRLGCSVLILKNNKSSVIWHGSSAADNSNKTTNNVKYSSCKGLNHERQPTKFAVFAILNFVSLRILFLSVLRLFYKQSTIRFMHKVHFDVDI